MFMDTFLIFSIWVSRDALMLSGVGNLSDFSRIVLVDSKIVFKSLGAWISFRSTLLIPGNADGKIKSSFLN